MNNSWKGTKHQLALERSHEAFGAEDGGWVKAVAPTAVQDHEPPRAALKSCCCLDAIEFPRTSCEGNEAGTPYA